MGFMRLAPTVTEQCYFMKKYAKVQNFKFTQIKRKYRFLSKSILLFTHKVVWNMLNVSDTIRVPGTLA